MQEEGRVDQLGLLRRQVFVERVGRHAFDTAHEVVRPVARCTTRVVAKTLGPPRATWGFLKCVRAFHKCLP